jgi:hypothetical protein
MSAGRGGEILGNGPMGERTKVEVKAAVRRAAVNRPQALEGYNRSKPTCKEVIKCCETH